MSLPRTIAKRTLQTFKSAPRPLPLANKKHQAEFEQLLRKHNPTPTAQNVSSQERHPDAAKETTGPFQGDVNPLTGEIGGPKGLEPTRYGDWERKGRVYDF